MESVCIVSSASKSIEAITTLLTEASIQIIDVASTAGEARRSIVEKDYDLYIINAPLRDEYGDDLAQDIASENLGQVLLMVSPDIMDEVAHKVEDAGVMTLSKPISKTLLWNAIKLAGAAQKQVLRMRSENKHLMERIEDIRIIDRAKCQLIATQAMTEEQAHRYIEKKAMNLRQTRREIADAILKFQEV